MTERALVPEWQVLTRSDKIYSDRSEAFGMCIHVNTIREGPIDGHALFRLE